MRVTREGGGKGERKGEVEWKVLVAGAVRRLFFGDGEIDLISTRWFRVCVCVCDVPCPPRVVCDVGLRRARGILCLMRRGGTVWWRRSRRESGTGQRIKAYGLLGRVMGGMSGL